MSEMNEMTAREEWTARLPKDARELARKLDQSATDWPEAERLKIRRGVAFASEAHQGQFRKSGESYVIHPMEVALLARALGMDADAVTAALLHDVAEDTDITLGQIEAEFGAPVASMVDALTKIDALKLASPQGENGAQAQNLRKMILAMSRDMRVILIKLCDRQHNMRTLGALRAERRRAIAKETLDIYAPIASRLGLSALCSEFHELCFKALNPWRHDVIQRALEKGRAHHKNFIEASVQKIQAELEREGIKAEVSGRRKSAQSVYAKMREKKLLLKDVLDREGFRVIVSSRSECYGALGALHGLWKPIPGFFKDYIAIPKINGYQSLHTALMSESGSPMEIQIRTAQMHHLAEEGLASHWIYKEKDGKASPSDSWVWLQSLLDIQAQSGHAEDFLEHVKTDLFSDEVYVFTPAGKVVALPRGACALDLAFAIHSDVGMRAVSAQVNQEECELSRKLRSGDSVSVQTAEEIQERPGWLSFVKTGKAKSHIRAHLRGMEQGRATELGQGLLEQALSDLGMGARAASSISAWKKATRALGISQQEILTKLACAQLSAVAVAQIMGKEEAPRGERAQRKALRVTGEESDFLKMGRCCGPLPPDPIRGEINPNQGMTVHRADCPQAGPGHGKIERVALEWEPSALTGSFSAWVKVKSKNERGALAKIAALIAAQGADVNNVRVSGNRVGDGRAVIHIEIHVRSKFHLDRVLVELAKEASVMP